MVIGIVIVVVDIVFDFGCSSIGERSSSASGSSRCGSDNVDSAGHNPVVSIKHSSGCGCGTKGGAAVLHTCAQAVGGRFHYQGYSVPR